MTDAAASSFRQIVVTGDVVVDHHVYQGNRRKPYSADGLGVRHVSAVGGAVGVRKLIEALGEREGALYEAEMDAARKQADKDAAAGKAVGKEVKVDRTKPHPIACVMGIDCPDVTPPHAPHHAFALWQPHKMTQRENEKREVWRTHLALGYGHDPIVTDQAAKSPPVPELVSKKIPPNPAVLVLEDSGSLFRIDSYQVCWHLPASDAPTWIVLKLSDPIAQGDLWRALVPKYAQRLAVVVAADDLRREIVRISEQLSWEQTLEDLAAALKGPVLQPLAQAAHLIVTFGGDAVVWIRAGGNGAAHFCFDAGAAEEDFAARHDGHAIGYMTCMASAVGYALSQGEPDRQLGAAIESGLRGMRDLLLYGHGPCDGPAPKGFPYERLAQAMRDPATDETNFSRIDIPWPPVVGGPTQWMIVESSQRPLAGGGKPTLVGLATEVLRRGSAAYARLPHVRFGGFVTAERAEVEALRGIRGMMRRYRHSKVDEKPLSIGVFGPPGAGKSYAVKQIAIDLFKEAAWLEFNLSQFSGTDDLIGALHQVRDRVLGGIIPVVFWDEFDSQNYAWLRSLLAPMQDGKFQEGQITHPVGHAVFIFAGGTAPTFDAFGPPDDPKTGDPKTGDPQTDEQREAERHWKLSKGPDFKSRLDAYYNVTGPNRRRLADQKTLDPNDIGYSLRRALLIRAQLGYKDDAPLQVDADLARALLLAPDYTHGSRSLEKLVRPLADGQGTPLRRSALPPLDILKMHVKDHDSFLKQLDRNADFLGSEAIEALAKAIHAHWQGFKEEEGVEKSAYFNREWAALDESAREDNRLAARRIPDVLALAGLGISADGGASAVGDDVLRAHLACNIERLAEAEHDGWCEARRRNGWRYAAKRDDGKKLHPLLVTYAKLSEPVKDKDRASVLHYPEMVRLAGYRIVWLGDCVRAAPT